MNCQVPAKNAVIMMQGVQALTEKLGAAGAVEFLQLHGSNHGCGDYTKERGSWLDHLTLEDIFEGIREMERNGV